MGRAAGSDDSDKRSSLAAVEPDLSEHRRTLTAVYRFALRPRWVLSHVLVAVLVVLMVSLGFWQLRRLDERRARNDLVSVRSEEPTASLPAVVDVDGSPDDAAAVRFRRVEASGSFEPGSDVLVRNRTFRGQPGSWLLAVLRLDDGDAVIVNRGWVPVTGEQEPPAGALAPAGPVTVIGLLETTQERGRFGSTDPADGRLQRVARVDVGRLARQIDGEVHPVWIQLEEQRPGSGDLPIPVEPPEQSEGNHFSYAVQWFIFSTIALVGYPLVLRRVARRSDDPPAEGDPPPWDDGDRVVTPAGAPGRPGG